MSQPTGPVFVFGVSATASMDVEPAPQPIESKEDIEEGTD